MHLNELETLDAFDAALADGLSRLRGWHLQSLDLSDRAHELSRISVSGAVFLGCVFAAGDGPGSEPDVRRRGGLVFPTVPEVPVNPYRGALYSPDELYAGLDGGYVATPDAAAYAWSLEGRSLDRTLAAALHDHAVDDALEEFTEGRDLVGIMGGHALKRDEQGYRDAAALGRALAKSFTVATGGGPGAMEAANLGAWFATSPDEVFEEALATLARVPDFSDITAWAQAAFAVRALEANGTASLGIPTWFYGHEPPNALASAIAKYFSNAVREDVLLRSCRGGLVFLPGAAGTVQEIFQAACANYYTEASQVVPMVLVGRAYWTEQIGVWDLLGTLAEGRAFGTALDLVDSTQEVLPLLVERSRDAR